MLVLFGIGATIYVGAGGVFIEFGMSVVDCCMFGVPFVIVDWAGEVVEGVESFIF